jgi:ribonuclease D
VAQAVAAWREQTAQDRNIPVRQVLPDLAVLGISQRQPTNTKELSQARGVDDRFTRGKVAEQLLAAVAEGRAAEPPPAIASNEDLDRDLRPAVTLIAAWVSQVAKRERIDTATLATRADLVAFLSDDPEARLATGWRNELLGEGIDRLIAGKAALTFDRGNGLRLVGVAEEPVADESVTGG